MSKRKSKIECTTPPDGYRDCLYYAGEDIDHNDLVYLGIDGCVYKVRNAIVNYTKINGKGRIIQVDGVRYEDVECGCCKKTFWVDMSSIPERGCWTCPYCTGLTIDERVKSADVMKLKFSTFKRKMEDNLHDMQSQIEKLE